MTADAETCSHLGGDPLLLKRALWIWPGHPDYDLHNRYALFRRKFFIAAVPSLARLQITADQSYRLIVNGRHVMSGPARGYQAQWPFDEVDLKPWLKSGGNVIAVKVHTPGASTFSYISQGHAGLLFALDMGEEMIVSDATWRCKIQDGVKRDTMPLSLQQSFQEHIDLRIESSDWANEDYPDTEWAFAERGRMWNAMPWNALEARGIPLLNETDIFFGKAIGYSRGISAPEAMTARDVFLCRTQEGLAHTKMTPTDFPIRVASEGGGVWQSYLVDMGRTVVGVPVIEIHEALGGEVVDLTFYETMDQITLAPDTELTSNSRLAIGARAILKAGTNTHSFFHPVGFRYAIVTLRDSTAAMQLSFSIRRMGYPLRREGLFRSSDARLERIWETCAWTQECCSMDAYVDTPWREQAQWWGDARVQAWNTFHLASDPLLLRRGLRIIAGQTTPEGLTYGHAPTKAHECILPDFSLIWILTLWDHYWQTGSTEAFQMHSITVRGILNYFRSHTDENTGLVRYDPRYWLFLDWANMYKEGCPTLLSLWLLEALDKLILLCEATHEQTEADSLRVWNYSLRAALQRLINDKGIVADGYDNANRLVERYSPHVQTLALMTNLEGVCKETILKTILLPLVQRRPQSEVAPSAYWYTYVFTELAKHGYGAEVIAFIRTEWEGMAIHGTTWETFQPRRGDESFSHAWSAHPLFHLMQILGGIRQTSPAWKTVSYAPLFIGDSVETVFPTPRGPISSKWERAGDEISIGLSLPPGISANVRIASEVSRNVEGVFTSTFSSTLLLNAQQSFQHVADILE